MTGPFSKRARAPFVVAAGFFAVGVVFAACTENQRGIGDDCLRDDDCLSGFCLSQHCEAPPTFSDGGGIGVGVGDGSVLRDGSADVLPVDANQGPDRDSAADVGEAGGG